MLRALPRRLSCHPADVQRLRPQTRALARRAFGVAAVPADEDSDLDFVLLLLNLGKESLYRLAEDLPLGGVELFIGNVRPDFAAVALQKLLHAPFVLRLGPGIDGAVVDGLRRIWHNQAHVVIHRVAETLAVRARAVGIVETEQRRLGRQKLDVALLAGETLGEAQADGFGLASLFEQDLAGLPVAGFDGVDNALPLAGADDETVGQNMDRAGEVDFEQGFGVENSKILPS